MQNRTGIAAVAAVCLLLAGAASAQERAGDVFVQLFRVGTVSETLGISDNGSAFNGVTAGIGCSPPGATPDTTDGADLLAFLRDPQTGPGLETPEESDLFRFCDAFTMNDMGGSGWTTNSAAEGTAGDGVRRMQQGLAPDELFMQTDQAASLAGLQVTNISQRIAQLHLTRRGTGAFSGYAFERGRDSPGAFEGAHGLREPAPAVGGETFARAMQKGFSSGDGLLGVDGLAAFVNGQYTRFDADSSSFETGSEGNGGGVTAGIDMQLGEQAFVGFAFGYSRLETDFDHDFGESSLDDYAFSLYGSTYFAERFYVDGIVTGSILRFDQERKVPSAVPGVTFNTIDSDPDGWNVTGDVGLGGEFRLDPVELNPYVRVALSHTNIDSFDEDGSTLALSVDEQENTSVTSTVGLSVSVPISTGFGVVSPYVRGEYLHEYNDQADEVSGTPLLNPTVGFELEPNNVDRNYFSAGAGVSAALGRGISAFADYDVVLGYRDLVVHQATLGGRFEF